MTVASVWTVGVMTLTIKPRTVQVTEIELTQNNNSNEVVHLTWRRALFSNTRVYKFFFRDLLWKC